MRTLDRRQRDEHRDIQAVRDVVERLSPSAANQILAATGADQAAWTASPTLTALTLTADAYDPDWDGNNTVPVKDAIFDKIDTPLTEQSDATWEAGTGTTPSIVAPDAIAAAIAALGTPPADGVAFLAFNSVTDTAQTGDGTAATIDFDTEVFDKGADFATDTFTAANTGLHQFNAQVTLIDLDQVAFTGVFLRIATSNRNYTFEWDMSQNAAGAATDQFSFSASVLADMDAADTATVVVDISGGTKTVDVLGHATTLYTFFSGHQVTNS